MRKSHPFSWVPVILILLREKKTHFGSLGQIPHSQRNLIETILKVKPSNKGKPFGFLEG